MRPRNDPIGLLLLLLKNNPNMEYSLASRERAIGNREKSANRSKKSFKTGVIFQSSNERERERERDHKKSIDGDEYLKQPLQPRDEEQHMKRRRSETLLIQQQQQPQLSCCFFFQSLQRITNGGTLTWIPRTLVMCSLF
jgi:hypothetical protein